MRYPPHGSKEGLFDLSLSEGGLFLCVGENDLATIESEFMVGIKGHGRPQPVNATTRASRSVITLTWDLETSPWEKYCGDLNFFVRFQSSTLTWAILLHEQLNFLYLKRKNGERRHIPVENVRKTETGYKGTLSSVSTIDSIKLYEGSEDDGFSEAASVRDENWFGRR